MVYCGKPSRACHACRARKTRCDAKPGGCTQCAKAKRKCPGYRQQVDLIFRDQSQNVIRRAKALEEKKASEKSSAKPIDIEDSDLEDSDPLASDFEYGDQALTKEWIPMSSDQEVAIWPSQTHFHVSLNPTVEERATCYFIENYAIGITTPGSGEFNSIQVHHVWNAMDPILAASVKAAALGSYANHVRSKEMEDSSRLEYAKAIRLTNAALSSSIDVKKDSTLLSVILLSLYEIITGRNQRSMRDWAQHVRGASALLKLRGPEQFDTPVGRRTFVQATGSLLASCLQRDMRLPSHILEMMYLLAEHSTSVVFADYVRRGVQMFQAMMDYNEFKCACSDGVFSDPREIIARAKVLDLPFEQAFQDMPSGWRYHEYHDDALDPGIVFNGYYHVHRDIWATSICNTIRIFRIMIHMHIRGALLAGFAAKPPLFTSAEDYAQLKRSTDICYQSQADVLATVPQSLGYVQKSGNWQAYASQDLPSDHPYPSPSTSPELSADDEATTKAPSRGTSSSPGTQWEFSWEDLIEDESPPSHNFTNTPSSPACHGFSLLWPLWFAGFMELASEDVRKYSILNLRRIGNDMGIQQAFVLAKTIETNTEPKAWREKV